MARLEAGFRLRVYRGKGSGTRHIKVSAEVILKRYFYQLSPEASDSFMFSVSLDI